MQKIFFLLAGLHVTIFLYSQKPVQYEPRHHNVFENEYVRVLDVFLGPGDTTEFHLHKTPSVFTTFTRTKTGSQLMGQPNTSGVSQAASTWYESLSVPRIHRVWSEDSTWFHVMDIELTGNKTQSDQPAVQNSSLQLLFNQPLVNGYHIQLAPGEVLKVPASGKGYLLLSLTDAVVDLHIGTAVQHRLMKAGHYSWIDAGATLSIYIKGQKNAGFTLLQLK